LPGFQNLQAYGTGHRPDRVNRGSKEKRAGAASVPVTCAGLDRLVRLGQGANTRSDRLLEVQGPGGGNGDPP